MIIRPRERGQVLILLGLWLLLAGSAASALLVYDRPIKEVQKAVKRTIPDGERRAILLDKISTWDSVQEIQNKNVSARREELVDTLKRKDAQRSEVEPILTKLDVTLDDMDRTYLNVRFQVKEQVSSAEWAKMVARPSP